MAIASEIARSFRQPRSVIRDLLSAGTREDRALGHLFIGCFLVFVAQWPRLLRVSLLADDDFVRLVAYEFMAWLLIWPSILYLFSGLLFLILRLLGLSPSGFEVRQAIFWSFLASTPLCLVFGILVGFGGYTVPVRVVGLAWILVLIYFMFLALAETTAQERSKQ